MPTIATFQQLLGQSIISPEVKQFVTKYQLKQYHKGGEGGFQNYYEIPFSLVYNNDHIDRIVISISHPDTKDYNNFAIYTAKLPYNLSRIDTPEEVINKLGPADYYQQGQNSLHYSKLNLNLLFDPAHKLREIDLDVAAMHN